MICTGRTDRSGWLIPAELQAAPRSRYRRVDAAGRIIPPAAACTLAGDGIVPWVTGARPSALFGSAYLIHCGGAVYTTPVIHPEVSSERTLSLRPAGEEFRAIMSHVTCDEGTFVTIEEWLVFTTHSLYLRGHSHKWRLGRMTVAVNRDCGEIVVTNNDNRKGVFHHPHINDQMTCFGATRTDALYSAWSKGEHALWIELLISALEAWNSDDEWGSNAALWIDSQEAIPL